MNSKFSTIFAGALIAGLTAGSLALADEAAHHEEAAPAHGKAEKKGNGKAHGKAAHKKDKAACTGHAGCKGEKKEEHKDEASH